MSSRQNVKRRRTSDFHFEDADLLTEKKSTKRSKRATESGSTSKDSMSPDSGDDPGDWSSYEQTLNRPTRVRKKSAKLLEAENIDHDFEKWKSPVPSSFPGTDVYAEIDERSSSSKKDSRYRYSEAKIPDVKITLGKDRDEKGSKKSKDKRKKSDMERSSFLEIDSEAKHKSSKKSKKSLPAPIPSIAETSFMSKEKESGIKLKLILSPKEKEKAEPIYEISSPEADMPPSLEKRKKKKKEKVQAKAKLIFQEQLDMVVPEIKKSKKNKKKKRSSDEREIVELSAEIVSDVAAKEKLSKKRKKKSHSGQGSNGFVDPDVLLEAELIIDEKPSKEKRKKQKKEKKEKEKKKSKDKGKDKVKIKLKLNEKDDMFGIETESHFEMPQSVMPSSELFPMGLKPLSGDIDSLQHLKQPSTVKKPSKPKPKKDKKGKKLKGDKKKDKKEKKEKKPLSAYMLWCNHYRSKLVADNPGIDFSTISKKLGAIWHTLTEKEKAKWKRKQKSQKTKHKNVPNLSKNRQELKEKAAKQRGTSPARKSGSPMKNSDAHTQPIDMAAHLKLLGESLSLVGNRLQEHQGNIEVHGSLSVLLDSTLCAISPLVGLTSQVSELEGCTHKTQVSTLDNIAYIMPGL